MAARGLRGRTQRHIARGMESPERLVVAARRKHDTHFRPRQSARHNFGRYSDDRYRLMECRTNFGVRWLDTALHSFASWRLCVNCFFTPRRKNAKGRKEESAAKP